MSKRLNIFLVEGQIIEPIGSPGAIVVCKTSKEAEEMTLAGSSEGALKPPLKVEEIGVASTKYKEPKILFLNNTEY